MSATVRVAPVDRWCEDERRYLRTHPDRAGLAGMLVAIRPATCSEPAPPEADYCGGKSWALTFESANQMLAAIGKPPIEPDEEAWICEHMLELD